MSEDFIEDPKLIPIFNQLVPNKSTGFHVRAI